MPRGDGQPATSADVHPWHMLDRRRVSPCASRYGSLQLFTQWALQPFTDPGPVLDGPILVPMDLDLEANTSAQRLCRGAWPATAKELEEAKCGAIDPDCPDCWWIVDVVARELVSDFIFPTEAQPPPIAGPDNLAPPRGIPTSRLKCKIEWMRAGLGASMICDIGTGIRLAIEGSDVTVNVLGPRGAMRVVGGQASGIAEPVPNFDPIPGFAQIILNTQVVGQVTRCLSTNADKEEVLTQLVRVEADGGPLDIAIPSRARFVQVRQPLPDVLIPPQLVVAPAGAVVQNLFYDPFTQPRQTNDQKIPESATHLRLAPTPPATSILYTITWNLEL